VAVSKEQIPPTVRPDLVEPVELSLIIETFGLMPVSGDVAVAVTGISMNTGDLRPGDLFVAMPGLKTHGAKFAQKAIELGAVAIVTDQAGLEEMAVVDAPVLVLEQPRLQLGALAAYVYGNGYGSMPTIYGTTGTNGKTSTTYILEAMLRQLGEVTGLTSTAERHIAGEVVVSRLTTPESTEMNALIARMREREVTSIAIEVSAQALTQYRVDGLKFDVVGFTNLSHDHLDDYPNMDEYLLAKVELFRPERARLGVVCLDSQYGQDFRNKSLIPTKTISMDSTKNADYLVTVTAEEPGRTKFFVETPSGQKIESELPIIGAHMAANAGLAIAMLIEAGHSESKIAAALAKGIECYLPGRTELVSPKGAPAIYVDFGHSPDAFLNTLAAVRKVTAGKVVMLFGADGDRDATKRPAMAQTAVLGSDILVITDHHPRFEDAASIRSTLEAAAELARPDGEIYNVSPPEAAIVKAVSLVGPGDAILWAGPGHQDYRDIRGVRTPYSARALARQALIEAGWK
jgi:UDP-N-acetylmuramoyl-L-alanyl-D-glutamate--2,6-diaminopimelate ligase